MRRIELVEKELKELKELGETRELREVSFLLSGEGQLAPQLLEKLCVRKRRQLK